MNSDEMFVSMTLSYSCVHCQAKAGEPCRDKKGRKADWHSARKQEVFTWAWEQRKKAREAGTEVCPCCAGNGRVKTFKCPCDDKKPDRSKQHPGHVRVCPHGVKWELIWSPVEEEEDRDVGDGKD